MPIDWPDQDRDQQKVDRQLPSYWGATRLGKNDWFDERTPRSRGRIMLPLLIVFGIVLIVGALLAVYGPVPRLFPQDCTGCFFSRP